MQTVFRRVICSFLIENVYPISGLSQTDLRSMKINESYTWVNIDCHI